ncbi:MAG: acyl-ACP thioesterase domain-containing protein, partial [Bacillota bacterium]
MHTFVQEQVILTHETDFQGLWRPDAAFRLMQEVAGAHSSQLGLSRSELVRNNIVWMIARAQLRIDRYPRLHDVVRAKTWYGRAGRTTFPRYVEIYGADGALLAAMSTSWILVDIVSRRILLPEKAGLSFPPPAELTPPLPEPGKLR